MHFLKFLEPLLQLLGRKSVQVSKLPLDGFALCGKLEVVFNDLAQQARQETQGKVWQRSKILSNKPSGLLRIAAEVFWFEIAWEHRAYSSSGRTFPCANAGEKPSIDPSVGTRSVDSVARSQINPSRTPGPSAIIQVVRDGVSPVR